MESSPTTIVPFLTVSNAAAAEAFYKSAFGAEELERHEMGDNRLSLKVAIGAAIFYLGDEEPEFGNMASHGMSSGPVRIILETKNADAIFQKAVEHNATQICPMTTEEDWRIGKLRDPFGHIWEIGFRL